MAEQKKSALSEGTRDALRRIQEDTEVLHGRIDRLAEQVRTVEAFLVELRMGERLTPDELELGVEGGDVPFNGVGFVGGRFKVTSTAGTWKPWHELSAAEKVAAFPFLEPLVKQIADRFHAFVTSTRAI